jgi:predicted metal-dependent phosphoesterase TrpH
MLIDLHAHSRPRSDDSDIRPTELVQRAKQAGLDGICLTEHDYFWDKDDLAVLSRENDFLVLSGAEMNTEEGHILTFGIDEYIFGMHRTEFLRRIVDEAGGVMILAHPYRRNYYHDRDLQATAEQYSRRPFFRLLDAIEVSNGRAKEIENEFSRELCRRLDLNGVGGSDAHATSDIPSSATLFERRIHNLEELITELKAGRFRPVDLRQGS